MTRASRMNGLKDKVRDWILRYGGITKEIAVKQFGCRQHEAEQVLHELNLEGVVGQAEHLVCHDSYPGSKCWHPDAYRKREKEEEEGFTIFEVLVGLLMLFGLAFLVVAFFALLKYVGWYG